MFGIRYCGGCNPHYDRVAFVKRIQEHFDGEAEFEVAQLDKEYEGLFVVGGCTNCCASHKQFITKTPPLLIWGEEFFDEVVKIVRRVKEK
ncbi:MAG: hypothetical protein IIY29_03255 [Firmicutes bacterium]|nr:hypothetical protein [Bacillota bacterium]